MQALPDTCITDAGRQWKLVLRHYHRQDTQGVALPLAPIPATSDHSRQTYSHTVGLTHPNDAIWRESRARMSESRRNHMAQSHTATRVTVTAPRMPHVHVVRIDGVAHTLTSRDMTPTLRHMCKLVRDAVQRETITWEERQELAQHVAHVTTDLREGLTQSREVRVNPRGASGLLRQGASNHSKRIAGLAEKVTQRDAHIPDMLVKQTPMGLVVGVATHPAASSRDYWYLLNEIRMHPATATVRVIPNGVASYMSPVTRQEGLNGRGTIEAVSDYGYISRPRQNGSRRVVEVSATPTSDDRLTDAEYARVTALRESRQTRESSQADYD